MSRFIRFFLAFSFAFMLAPTVWAHAFPQTTTPAAGATLTHSPTLVKILFTGEIEPVFSTLIVKNAAGKQVSQKKGTVLKNHKRVLETRLPAKLPAGQYTVYWSVIAHDGHHTHGHYEFTVK